MKNKFALTREDFETLLRNLSADRNEAGEKYEEIRLGLIRYFRFRGCPNSQALADETINRAASKIGDFNSADRDKIMSYFYGFAKMIHLEYCTREANREVPFESRRFYLSSEANEEENEEKEFVSDCLEKCLTELGVENRDLLLQYYSKNKSAKVELRTNLADRMELRKGTLHTKVFRLRNTLKKCMEKCLKEKNL